MALAVSTYFVVAAANDWIQIRNSIAGISPMQLGVILTLSLINYGLRWWRWDGYFRTLGFHIPWPRHLAYYFAGFAFTVTPGKAGEAVRAVYLKPHGVHYMQTLAALFMERLLDLLAICALAVLVLGQFADYGWLLAVMLGAVVMTVWLLGTDLPARWARRIESRVALKSLGYLLRHGADMLESTAILRRHGGFLRGLLLGILAWGAEGLALYLILDWLGAEVSLPLAVGIYALSMLGGAISFMPGGLGGAEATMGILLALCGVSPGLAIAATILCRLTTLWFAVVIGALAAGIIGARYPQSSPSS